MMRDGEEKDFQERNPRLFEIGISEKTCLAELNEEQLAFYKLSDTTTPLVIRPTTLITAVVPKVLYWDKLIYTKEILPLESKASPRPREQAHQIAVIKKDGEPESFVWRTGAEQLRKAVRYGVVTPEALTGKAISKLGAYRPIVLERIYEDRIYSNKFQEKEALLSFTQDRIELLQPLERLINSYNRNLSPEKNYAVVTQKLEEYKQALLKQKESISLKDQMRILEKHNSNVLAEIENCIQNDIKEIEQWVAWLELNKKRDKLDLAGFLSSTGHKSLMHFIRGRINGALHQAQMFNQQMTHADWSLSRGKFNDICADAIKEVSDYQVDPNNPILSEHQGSFDSATALYSHEFSLHETTDEAVRQKLMAISHIEGLDRINSNNHFIVLPNGKRYLLMQTRMVYWRSLTASFTSGIGRLFKAVVNLVAGVVGNILDIPLGFVAGVTGWKIVSLADKLKFKSTVEAIEGTQFSKLAKKIHVPQPSFGFQVGAFFPRLFKNTVVEAIWGMGVVFKDSIEHFYSTVKDDADLISNPKSDDEILRQFNSELKVLNRQFRGVRKKLLKEHKLFDEKLIKHTELQGRLAIPSYHLSPGEFNDIGNVAVGGIKAASEMFTHPLFTKSPMRGLLFSAFYAVGGLAVYSPQWVGFLPKEYMKFSKHFGEMLANGTNGVAISSGFFQAQIASGLFDAALHGRNSDLADFVKNIEQEPENIVIFGTGAAYIGYFVAYKAHIPWLSHFLQEELGEDAKMASLVSIGAKVGLTLTHLFETKESPASAPYDEETLKKGLKQDMKDVYCAVKKISAESLADENLREIDVAIEKLFELSTEKLKQFVPEFQEKFLKKDAEEKKEIKEENGFNRAAFLLNIERNAASLPHLHHTTKRELLGLAKRHFKENPEVETALRGRLYPEEPHSVFATTFIVIFSYIPHLLRCGFVLYSRSAQPWADLKTKFKKDIARIANIIGNSLNFAVTFLGVCARWLGDIIGNEILARAERIIRAIGFALKWCASAIWSGIQWCGSKIRGVFSRGTPANTKAKSSIVGEEESAKSSNHLITSLMYTMSEWIRHKGDTGREFLGQPIDAIKKDVVPPAPSHSFKPFMGQHFKLGEGSVVEEKEETKGRHSTHTPMGHNKQT